ncbi:RNA polymerase sigma-70 factor [Desertivirga brevis]|uniref:RNA polymerase sigma-70 factor n=1 Tax=Desertivirga brevis TaxID=2810310 RepID=UPI001A96AB25|nr:RNA polymerase sigma-70 factor [Pedobacter sp. SYSU D00873]
MTKTKNLSDEVLIGLLKDGDVAAFEEVYNRYWEKLYNAAAKRVSATESAEEIVQDFFTSLWCNRAKVKIHSCFNNYAFSSIRYLVYNHYQKESLRKAYQESRLKSSVMEDNSTEEFIALKELSYVLEEGVEKLPSKCKTVYELSRKEYKNNKEIAALLGISEKTVENHLTKALRNIRLSLRDALSLTALIFNFIFRN